MVRIRAARAAASGSGCGRSGHLQPRDEAKSCGQSMVYFAQPESNPLQHRLGAQAPAQHGIQFWMHVDNGPLAHNARKDMHTPYK